MTDTASGVHSPADPDAAATLIHCRALSKHFNGEPAVKDLDLDIPPRCCFGLLGPNGAGKTTTLRMLLGQSPRSSGTLQLFGRDVDISRREIRQRTGIVPQADNLDPDFTVAENLRIYGLYFRLPPATLEQRIPQLLKMVELGHRSGDRINTLSGGMKRRLTLARALINDPDLLVLDEPTTGLDPQARHMMWSLVHRMKRGGKTIVLTTHYMEEAERLCDELVIIDHGKLLAQGSPVQLIQEHCEKEVLEIRDEIPDDLAEQQPPGGCRVERADDTLYVYGNDTEQLLALAGDLPQSTCLHRRSGLEDVFLRLTGRALRS
ncbi:MAG: ATP-binding cassette domain-containing protein [Arenicellales bacterium]|jgi:lipooligosaccharide transport system ATP-binding protein|nr:ATP-binding cassette domain-containing protein [Arenicellales bacterium]MDP6313295.1 ATP-binding cassette domain-containing protein [Arenicellales bacterium]MDP7119247.1 ATP-binding cassette domain-containing protein [Arenicellales bacterium]MDP7192566.1 ATP-binding cassette domain-containing protein [Arenicellales bacterium]MDP7491051.1 ATP-binding cassette domain-containing protein [Arenicellales bacterium]|tara:strand:+ start:2651 stop:3610 length:960 start_codon:yes stop_codon:yes gene_type:complete